MVMYKHNIPLVPSEKIGHYLGLIVHPDNQSLFYGARTSKIPPRAGYGTRIYQPKYKPTKALRKLKIPLEIKIVPAIQFKTKNELKTYLSQVEKQDKDVFFCFNYGALINDSNKSGGHVVVFDRLKRGGIRIIDPSPNKPKWRIVTLVKMFKAMKKHSEKSGGVWEISKI